jgi:hypothetical protein
MGMGCYFFSATGAGDDRAEPDTDRLDTGRDASGVAERFSCCEIVCRSISIHKPAAKFVGGHNGTYNTDPLNDGRPT